jgi:hypothetical protein
LSWPYPRCNEAAHSIYQIGPVKVTHHNIGPVEAQLFGNVPSHKLRRRRCIGYNGDSGQDILQDAELAVFRTMLAHYHGQIWSSAELARSLGSSEPVVSDLFFTGLPKGLSLVDRLSVPKESSNVTGDKLITDGKSTVLLF